MIAKDLALHSLSLADIYPHWNWWIDTFMIHSSVYTDRRKQEKSSESWITRCGACETEGKTKLFPLIDWCVWWAMINVYVSLHRSLYLCLCVCDFFVSQFYVCMCIIRIKTLRCGYWWSIGRFHIAFSGDLSIIDFFM